jgi:hypothetical protein
MDEDRVIYWVRSSYRGSDELVAMYDKGPCRNGRDGAPGIDRHVRPVRLGPGEYTMTIGRGDWKEQPDDNDTIADN